MATIRDVAPAEDEDVIYLLAWDRAEIFNRVVELSLQDLKPVRYFELLDSDGVPLEWATGLGAPRHAGEILVYDGASQRLLRYSLP